MIQHLSEGGNLKEMVLSIDLTDQKIYAKEYHSSTDFKIFNTSVEFLALYPPP